MLRELQKNIDYDFNDEGLLVNALTHSSYANERPDTAGSNERLEFLGDSVLGVITAEILYSILEDVSEGVLTKIRAALVCEKSLFKFSKEIELGRYIYMGKGEEFTGGRERPALLADAFEAIIGAIYLDGGLDAARRFITPFIGSSLSQRVHSDLFNDYKTILQEVVQKNPGEKISYRICDEYGPDHDKTFVCEVLLNSNCIGKGSGKSKKDAQQQAAKEALHLMGIE